MALMSWGEEQILGRVLRLITLPEPGCVLGPVNDDGVRMMQLSVACYDNETTVVERNGRAV